MISWTAALLFSIAPLEVSPDWFRVDGFDEEPITARRIGTLKIRDPHLFTQVPIFGCRDITDNDVPGFPGSAVNNQIATQLNNDGNGDGFLDASTLKLFRPAPDGGRIRRLDTAPGQCTLPVASTTCLVGTLSSVENYWTHTGADSCLAALPGTTGGYNPPVPTIAPPCWLGDFLQESQTDFNGLQITLRNSRSAGAAPSGLPGGIALSRGFLSESDANMILIPATIPLIGGRPLSSLLKGGQGNCASGDDRDLLQGQMGWWFYFEQGLVGVPLTGAR